MYDVQVPQVLGVGRGANSPNFQELLTKRASFVRVSRPFKFTVMSDADSNATSGGSRKRQPNACNYCRRRKVRCKSFHTLGESLLSERFTGDSATRGGEACSNCTSMKVGFWSFKIQPFSFNKRLTVSIRYRERYSHSTTYQQQGFNPDNFRKEDHLLGMNFQTKYRHVSVGINTSKFPLDDPRSSKVTT